MCPHNDLYHYLAWRWREFLGTWGEEKETGLFRFVLWNGGKETPHTHDMNMEGKERKNNGGERKRKMPRFSNLLPSWRTSGTCVCVCVSVSQESKSRIIEGIEGIGQPS